jgi:hypothetical protein
LFPLFLSKQVPCYCSRNLAGDFLQRREKEKEILTLNSELVECFKLTKENKMGTYQEHLDFEAGAEDMELYAMRQEALEVGRNEALYHAEEMREEWTNTPESIKQEIYAEHEASDWEIRQANDLPVEACLF